MRKSQKFARDPVQMRSIIRIMIDFMINQDILRGILSDEDQRRSEHSAIGRK
jgi:hypothetical protein